MPSLTSLLESPQKDSFNVRKWLELKDSTLFILIFLKIILKQIKKKTPEVNERYKEKDLFLIQNLFTNVPVSEFYKLIIPLWNSSVEVLYEGAIDYLETVLIIREISNENPQGSQVSKGPLG